MDIIQQMLDGMGKMLAKILLGKEAKKEIFVEHAAVGDRLQGKLSALVAEGKINAAEDLLFEELGLFSCPEVYMAGLDFYEHLNSLSEEYLRECDFSKEEIRQGLNDMQKVVLVIKA